MKPFFFGSSDAQLYGVYNPPAAKPHRDEAVILCYAFGQEYMRSHRAYRQLTNLLTKKGFHVMRFDYRGTGDSADEMENMLATDWLDDVEQAVEEVRESSGVSKVSLVGLRFGSLIAATAASTKVEVDRLVVWDPLLSGGAYEQELISEMPEGEGEYANFLGGDGELHFNGFSMTQKFRENMKQFDLSSLKPKAQQILQVVSHESDAFKQLREAWGELPGYRYERADAPGDWNYVDNFGGILLPQPVIQAIVNWFDQ